MSPARLPGNPESEEETGETLGNNLWQEGQEGGRRKDGEKAPECPHVSQDTQDPPSLSSTRGPEMEKVPLPGGHVLGQCLELQIYRRARNVVPGLLPDSD